MLPIVYAMYVQYVYVSTISTGEIPADEKHFHKNMEEGWSTRGREASKKMYRPAAKAKVCCRIAQDCTVYTLSHVSIPPVLRRSHSADDELYLGIYRGQWREFYTNLIVS